MRLYEAARALSRPAPALGGGSGPCQCSSRKKRTRPDRKNILTLCRAWSAAAFNPHNPALRCGLVHRAISSLSRRSETSCYPAASAAKLMRSFSVTALQNTPTTHIPNHFHLRQQPEISDASVILKVGRWTKKCPHRNTQLKSRTRNVLTARSPKPAVSVPAQIQPVTGWPAANFASSLRRTVRSSPSTAPKCSRPSRLKVAIENHLADLIVFDEWRRIRIRGLENEIFAMGFTTAKDQFFAGAETWLAKSKELATLTLYEQRIARVLSHNKAELEARQFARKTSGADLLVCAESRLPEAVLHPTTRIRTRNLRARSLRANRNRRPRTRWWVRSFERRIGPGR